MIIETCSGRRHFFNKILKSLNEEIYGKWDRKCDCGKKKVSVKDYGEWRKAYDNTR